MLLGLGIVLLVVLCRLILWAGAAFFGWIGENSGHAGSAFDVFVYQHTPSGATWAFCRRHADYYSTLRDIQYLQACGYAATFVQR